MSGHGAGERHRAGLSEAPDQFALTLRRHGHHVGLLAIGHVRHRGHHLRVLFELRLGADGEFMAQVALVDDDDANGLARLDMHHVRREAHPVVGQDANRPAHRGGRARPTHAHRVPGNRGLRHCLTLGHGSHAGHRAHARHRGHRRGGGGGPGAGAKAAKRQRRQDILDLEHAVHPEGGLKEHQNQKCTPATTSVVSRRSPAAWA